MSLEVLKQIAHLARKAHNDATKLSYLMGEVCSRPDDVALVVSKLTSKRLTAIGSVLNDVSFERIAVGHRHVCNGKYARSLAASFDPPVSGDDDISLEESLRQSDHSNGHVA